ncbi:hypothetical protein ACET3Z_017356 [Daucus carota]
MFANLERASSPLPNEDTALRDGWHISSSLSALFVGSSGKRRRRVVQTHKENTPPAQGQHLNSGNTPGNPPSTPSLPPRLFQSGMSHVPSLLNLRVVDFEREAVLVAMSGQRRNLADLPYIYYELQLWNIAARFLLGKVILDFACYARFVNFKRVTKGSGVVLGDSFFLSIDNLCMICQAHSEGPRAWILLVRHKNDRGAEAWEGLDKDCFHMNQVWLPRTGTIRATNKRSMTELIKKKEFRKYRCRNQILQSSNTELLKDIRETGTDWYQRQEEQAEGVERKQKISHVHIYQKLSIPPVHMSNFEFSELTWENGYLATHELGGIFPAAPTKSNWGRRDDTLESIVHHATSHGQGITPDQAAQQHISVAHREKPVIVASSDGKWGENLSQVEMALGFPRKRDWTEYSNQCERNFNSCNQEGGEPGACASASATFCRDKDNTMMTWASSESPQTLKSKSANEDSAFLDDRETQETKGEANESRSTRQTRRSRIASVHNQSERKRRERINQKMKALQKLVPNANKTDKASMLDEVIAYLKQLQAQVHMMSMRNNIPQMMMPLGMQQQQQLQLQQQHLQMSLLARMGMGFGLGMNTGMLDMNTLAQCFSPLIHQNSVTPATPGLVTQPFVSPPTMKRHISPEATPTQGASNTSVPFNDPYCAFLAQSMNMELYNKMTAYHQQVNQAAQALHGDKKSNQLQGE